MPGQPDSYYTQVLNNLNAPVTAGNLAVLKAWGSLEAVNPTYHNAFGIIDTSTKYPARWADVNTGAAQTATFLKASGKGKRYSKIIASLQQDNAEQAVYEIVQSPWNVYHYGAPVINSTAPGLHYDYRQSSLFKVWQQQGARPTGNLNPDIITHVTGGGIDWNPLHIKGPHGSIIDLGKNPFGGFAWLSNKEFWRRTALIGGGSVAVIIGGILLLGGSKTLREAGKVGLSLAGSGEAKVAANALKGVSS